MQRKGVRSTKLKPPELALDPEPLLDPPRSHIDCKHKVGAQLVKMEQLKGMIFTDLQGRFPFTSSRGHKYIFVLYDYDSNAILAETIKIEAQTNLSVVTQCVTTNFSMPVLFQQVNYVSNRSYGPPHRSN